MTTDSVYAGVHSIERSAQEDALLVLFNAAISSLVRTRRRFFDRVANLREMTLC